MKYSGVVFFITVAFVVFAAEARLKRKFDSDFVFAEDNDSSKDDSKLNTGKKKWIHDPDSDLCVPLKCKKKELCLLENLYTAVCVSKKELHKNGDIIMSKSRYLAEEAKKKAYDDLDDDDDADDDDDDDDDMDDDDDDDLFYDSSASSAAALSVETNTNDRKCNPCPIKKPVFICGADNRTYSSICRLDYHNCLYNSSIKATCKGFCPCKDSSAEKQLTGSSVVGKSKYGFDKMKKKTESKQSMPDKYSLTPEDFKYENKHYKYIKYTKNNDAKSYKDLYFNTEASYYHEKDRSRGENEVDDEKPLPAKPIKKKECSEAALKSMGNRLLDWFSVIKAENKRRPEYKGKDIVSFGCKPEVIWMFKHLDLDGDGQLTLQELYDLEHDQNEHCIKPFLDMCDTNRDIFISPFEWCYCFMKSERPCAAVRKRIPQHIMTGVYVPSCDSEGYYDSMQCHAATGMCWCVNKHGVEFANSRTHGKVDCDLYFIKAGVTERTTPAAVKFEPKPNDNDNFGNKKINNNTDDDDDDDSDDDDDFNGSGDQPLEF